MQITKPQTQRKRLFQAAAHLRRRYFSAPLSPDLKRKHGANAVPVRMGDTVRIMRGDRKGFEGKVTRVSRKKYRIFVEGVTRDKVDGTTIQIPISPSKVMIINLDLDDKWRREALKRKGAFPEEAAPPAKEAELEAPEEIEEIPQAKEARARAKKPRRRKKKEEQAKPAPEKKKKTEKKKAGRRRARKRKVEEGAE